MTKNVKQPTTFAEWLARRDARTKVDKDYTLPLTIDSLPCGCRRPVVQVHRDIFKGEVDLSWWEEVEMKLEVRKQGKDWFCVECGARLNTI